MFVARLRTYADGHCLCPRFAPETPGEHLTDEDREWDPLTTILRTVCPQEDEARWRHEAQAQTGRPDRHAAWSRVLIPN